MAVLAIVGPVMLRPAQKTVSGSISAGDQGSSVQGCTGGDVPEDVVAGAQLQLSGADESFRRVATLKAGTFDGASCVFGFTFHNVPAASSYTVRLAGRIVGQKKYTHQQLVASHWALYLPGRA